MSPSTISEVCISFLYKLTQFCLLISRPFDDFPTVLNVYILRTKINNICCLLLFAPDYKDLLTEPSALVHFPLAKLSIWHSALAVSKCCNEVWLKCYPAEQSLCFLLKMISWLQGFLQLL